MAAAQAPTVQIPASRVESFLREREQIRAFIQKIQSPLAKVGFGELAEVGLALRMVSKANADPELIQRYNGEFVSPDVRKAVAEAASVSDLLGRY